MNPAFSVPQLKSFLPLFQRMANKVRVAAFLLNAMTTRSHTNRQLSQKWKGELVATGELNLMLNRWLSRATLDVIGEGEQHTS